MKRLALAVVLVLAVVALAGCSDGGGAQRVYEGSSPTTPLAVARDGSGTAVYLPPCFEGFIGLTVAPKTDWSKFYWHISLALGGPTVQPGATAYANGPAGLSTITLGHAPAHYTEASPWVDPPPDETLVVQATKPDWASARVEYRSADLKPDLLYSNGKYLSAEEFSRTATCPTSPTRS